MVKNEAKIKFTAETGSFNDAIKKSNDEMSRLRAEMKLNDTQMKATGESVEGLENKHKILSDQLVASQNKTEALTQKVNKAVELFGEGSTEVNKLRTQLLNAQTAEEKIRQAISACNDELEEQKSAASKAESASEQLTDTIKRQQSELNGLKKDYVDAVLQYGETSDEAKQLEKAISNLSGELKDSKSAMSDASNKADELDRTLDNVEDSADGADDGFTILKGTVADLASSAIQGAISKISEFIGYLGQLPAETMELRQNLATLTTSFDNVGFTTDTAKETWKELYSVIGDEGASVEAANNISKLAKSEEDLNKWTTILTGVYGTYQDSLPIEGLAEAANETVKTGQVTGSFADTLNWSSEAASMFAKYMSEDVTTAEDAFNVALSECTTEQERQKLITDTLTTLYGDAATTYRDTASAQLEAKEATAEQMLAENELADSLEPVTTAYTELKTQLMEGLQPAIEKVSGVMLDALEWAREHPVAMKVFAAVIGVVATALGALAIVVAAYTVAQWAMNAAVLANPITWIIVGIVAAIAAVVAIIVLVIEYWDEIVVAVKNCWESVKNTLLQWGTWINTNVIQPIVNFFKGIWDGIVNVFQSVIDWVKDNWKSIVTFITNPFAGIFNYLYNNFEGFRSFIDKIVSNIKQFFSNLWEGVKNVWDNICNAISVAIQFIGSLISAAFQIITLPFRFIWENCKEYVFAAWEWIKEKVSTAINAVKTVISNVMNTIKTVFSTIWNGIKNVVSNVWNAIKTAVTTRINAVKSVISSVWNGVKSVTTTIFNAIKSVITTVWNAIKSKVTSVVNSIKSVISTVFNAIKSTVTSIFNAVKSTATSVWNGIKNTISNVVNNVKSKVSSVFNSMKSTVSNVFNGIKSTATSVWNGIKSAITKPIEEAKNKVKSVIDAIKGFFSGLKLKLPKIKLPHFKVTGKLSLNPPSVPKLSIDWYKEGGILTKPTIFGVNGSSLMAGGEAGAEAILPIDKLEGYIEGAIEKTMQKVDLQILADAISDLASRPVELAIDGRAFAIATASASDNVNGLRSTFRSRGLVLE